LNPRHAPYVVWLLATAISAALWQVGKAVPWIWDNLPALVAFVFLYLPVAIAWRRKVELATFGFTFRPVERSLRFGLGGPLLVFPLFLALFYFFYVVVCQPHAPAWLAELAPARWCSTFTGWRHAHPPDLLSWDFAEKAFTQVVVVALPEELFFRGYLLGELERIHPPRRRLLGGGIGLALLVSAALFALGHVLVDLDPRRLIVFFPGLLFGWMRSATGSIVASTITHGCSNILARALEISVTR
jgi:membrane protease YdiL (CAAX protease family)